MHASDIRVRRFRMKEKGEYFILDAHGNFQIATVMRQNRDGVTYEVRVHAPGSPEMTMHLDAASIYDKPGGYESDYDFSAIESLDFSKMKSRFKFWKHFAQIAQRAFPTPELFERLQREKSQRYKEVWYLTHQDKQWGDLNPANSDHQDWFAWWKLCLQNFFDELKHLKAPYGHLADKDRSRVILDQFPSYDRMFVNPMALSQDILRSVGPANKALRVMWDAALNWDEEPERMKQLEKAQNADLSVDIYGPTYAAVVLHEAADRRYARDLSKLLIASTGTDAQLRCWVTRGMDMSDIERDELTPEHRLFRRERWTAQEFTENGFAAYLASSPEVRYIKNPPGMPPGTDLEHMTEHELLIKFGTGVGAQAWEEGEDTGLFQLNVFKQQHEFERYSKSRAAGSTWAKAEEGRLLPYTIDEMEYHDWKTYVECEKELAGHYRKVYGDATCRPKWDSAIRRPDKDHLDNMRFLAEELINREANAYGYGLPRYIKRFNELRKDWTRLRNKIDSLTRKQMNAQSEPEKEALKKKLEHNYFGFLQ